MSNIPVPQYSELVTPAIDNGDAAVFVLLETDAPTMPPWSQQAADAEKAPGATTIVAMPNAPSAADLQNLNDIQLLDAYVSAASALLMYKKNPQGWNLADPNSAADYTQKLANAKFQIITQGLGGVLSNHSSTASSFSKSTTSADLHFDFLSSLFGGFGFGDQSMKELDGILTNVANSLKDLKASWSQSSQTIDHLICFHYFDKEDGLDVKIPYMRIFFLHIDQSSWSVSIGKSSISEFQFHMGYDDNIFAMTNQVANTRGDLEKYLKDFTKMGLEEVINLVKPKAVTDDRPGQQ